VLPCASPSHISVSSRLSEFSRMGSRTSLLANSHMQSAFSALPAIQENGVPALVFAMRVRQVDLLERRYCAAIFW